MKQNAFLGAVLLILIALSVSVLGPIDLTGLFVSVESGEMNLTLWDNAESKGGGLNVYADGSGQASGPGSTDLAVFYVNFTNLTSGEAINGSGVECNLSINLSSGWTAPDTMWFNESSMLYEGNHSFSSRGNYSWNATCDGTSRGHGVLSALENVSVADTPAQISVPLSTKTCYEDQLCVYNFSADCFDIDDVDEGDLTYGYKAGTEFDGFNMSANGNITVNVTDDAGCGEFSVTLIDKDSAGLGSTADKNFIVNAVNDVPSLGSITGTYYENSSAYQDISATDEESPSGPFFFNITLISCHRPFNNQYSNATDCSALFQIDSGTGEFSSTGVFGNSDVGEYTINFTVTDPGDNATNKSIPPYAWLANETGATLLNITVTDVNNMPSMESVPDQFWIQNQTRNLTVNVADVDNGTFVFNVTTLYRNLSAYYNSSLFIVHSNHTSRLDNGTALGNMTIRLDPVENRHVGNYTLNVSVHDGRENGTASLLVNFTVTNINDPPEMAFDCGNYSVEGLEYYCDVSSNTSDPDDFPSYVPYNDTVNGTLAYSMNFTYCNKTFNASDTNCSIFAIDNITGIVNYTEPLRKDSGNYTINISVTDGGNITVSHVFNFTVVDDYAPVMGSVQDQITQQNDSFYLSFNATDRDNATDTLYIWSDTYYNGSLVNETLFPIQNNLSGWPGEPAYGIMNYTPVNNSQVGNYTVKLIVNDSWGREDYVEVNFTVMNLNDEPQINFSCGNHVYENSEYYCDVGENTTDPDTQTPYGDVLNYSITFNTGFPYFDVNHSTGVMNFTALNETWTNQSANYTYNLTVCVSDSDGSSDCQNMTILIHAVNDAPEFTFTNMSATANSPYFENLSAETTDEEGDVPLNFNLSVVNCSKDNASDTNCSVISMDPLTGVIDFTPPEKDSGNYTLNVTVTDSGNDTLPHNASSSEIVDFEIEAYNNPPSVDIVSTMEGDTVYENESITFLITVSDPDGDSLYCKWYLENTYIGELYSCQNYNTWSYTPGFADSGGWDFELEAYDDVTSGSDTYRMNILNRNRPPELIYSIQNQSWNMNTDNENIILSYNFRDPDNANNVTNDDNNLTINHTMPSHISVLVDDQGGDNVTVDAANWSGSGRVTLTPETDWYGSEVIVFTVSDHEFNASSGNVTLNVSYSEPPTETIIQQIEGGGGTSIQEQIASLTITTSPIEAIGSMNETETEVMLENTGDVALNAVNVTTYVNEIDEVGLSLDREYFSQIAVGENVTTNLTIETGELTKETYEIKITGMVTRPRFNQSSTIYLRSIHGVARVKDRIKLAKDLFQDNPECLDLTELILEAERELGENNMEKARELTEKALDNCRDIIKYTNATKKRITAGAEEVPVKEILIAFLSISLVTILVYIWMESRSGGKRGK